MLPHHNDITSLLSKSVKALALESSFSRQHISKNRNINLVSNAISFSEDYTYIQTWLGIVTSISLIHKASSLRWAPLAASKNSKGTEVKSRRPDRLQSYSIYVVNAQNLLELDTNKIKNLKSNTKTSMEQLRAFTTRSSTINPFCWTKQNPQILLKLSQSTARILISNVSKRRES